MRKKSHAKILSCIFLGAMVGIVAWWLFFGGRDKVSITPRFFTHFSGYTMGIGGWNKETLPTSKYSLPFANIRRINVMWKNGRVNIFTTDGEEIVFSESTGESLSGDKCLRYRVNSGSLDIIYCSEDVENRPQAKDLTVKIPASMQNGLVKVRVETAEGTIDINKIQAMLVELKSLSGEIVLKNVKAQRLMTTTLSGKTGAENIYFNTVNMTSGSGLISVHGYMQMAKIKTVSGDILISDKVYPKTLDIETVSGNSRLFIHDAKGFVLTYNTRTGNLSSDFELKSDEQIHKYGSPISRAKWNVVSNSGNFDIIKK